MKRICLSLLLVLSAQAVMAQDTDFQSRTALNIRWRVSDRLSVSSKYELRLRDGMAAVERNQFSADAIYRLGRNVRVDAGYVYMGLMDADTGFDPRHRLNAGFTADVDSGHWRFTFREGIQATFRHTTMLRTRFGVSYRGLPSLRPYTYIELRNVFAAQTGASSQKLNTSTGFRLRITGWLGSNFAFLTDWDSNETICFRHFRGQYGLDWRVSDTHSFDFRIIYDFYRYTSEAMAFCLSYRLSF